MFLEAWEVVVSNELYIRARHSDERAKNELREQFDRMELYTHAFPVGKDERVITFIDLVNLGVVLDIATRGQFIILITKKDAHGLPDYTGIHDDNN